MSSPPPPFQQGASPTPRTSQLDTRAPSTYHEDTQYFIPFTRTCAVRRKRLIIMVFIITTLISHHIVHPSLLPEDHHYPLQCRSDRREGPTCIQNGSAHATKCPLEILFYFVLFPFFLLSLLFPPQATLTSPPPSPHPLFSKTRRGKASGPHLPPYLPSFNKTTSRWAWPRRSA